MHDAIALLQQALGHYQRGELAPAAQWCRAALEGQPHLPDGWHLLGAVEYQQGQAADALQAVERAVAQRPEKAEYYSTLGCILQTLGRREESLQAHRQAVALAPQTASFHCNLGAALQEAGAIDEAAQAYTQALRLAPQLVEAHYNLGNLCVTAGQLKEAEIAFRRAVQLCPQHVQAVANLANVQLEQGRYEEALVGCRRAVELAPRNDELQYRRAIVLRRLGRAEEALDAYAAAVAINPQHAEARFGQALVWLQRGDYARGWPAFEQRRLRRSLPHRAAPSVPEWDGRSANERHIGLWCEESLEDEILWASCLQDLLAVAGGVSIECDTRLVPLMRRSFPAANIHCREKWDTPAWGAHTSQVDCHLPLGSLPGLVRPTAESFPPPHPFLKADDEDRLRWRERLAGLGSGARIGFCWQPTDLAPRESCDERQLASRWARLLGLPGVQWINLNSQAPLHLFDQLRHEHGVNVLDWSDCDFVNDLDQLASLLSALDLVVTTPNYVAHLAGALGVETWTVLPADSSWYWGLDRTDSPWYAKTRLFRTPRGGDADVGLESTLDDVRRTLATKLNIDGPAPAFTPKPAAEAPPPAAPDEGRRAAVESEIQLGKQLEVAKRNGDAIDHYRRALAQCGDDPGLNMRLGVVLLLEERFDEALEALQRAVAAAPHDPICLFHLAVGYSDARRKEEAVATLRKALRIRPHFFEAHLNLGAILEGMGRLDESVAYCQHAAALNPDSSSAHYNLGNVRLHLGHLEAALESYARVLEIEPDFPKAHWNRAVVLLLLRRFGEAWPEWKFREAAGEVMIDHFDVPVWDGSSLAGKTIMIHAEQGIGDEIMFASCFGEVIAQAKHTILACAPRLTALFARSFPTAEVLAIGRPCTPDWLPAGVDVTVTAGDLPGILRTSEAAFPRQQSFLVPDAELVAKWRARIAALGPGLKVGVSWRAGGKSSEQRRRTSPLDDWGPVFQVPGVHFINLQYGNSVQDIAFAREKFGAVIHDWPDADPLKDMDNFAAQVAALDMVFSIGNTTIHTAGALGVRTWAMAPHVPGWRYMISGEVMPWYRSVTIHRQTRPDDWTGLYSRMADRLRTYAASLGFDERTVPRAAVTGGAARAAANTVATTTALELPQPAADASAADLVTTALVHHRAGQKAQAESLYRQAIALDADNWNALQLLGIIASETGRPTEAIELMERALALKDGQEKVRYNLANVLRSQGRLDDAVRHLQIAVKNRPQFAEAHLNLGCALQQRGDWNEALAAYRRAVDLKPTCAEAHHNIGHLLFEQEHYREAIERYRRAVELRPNYPDALAHLGEALRRSGKLAEADEVLRSAVELAPSDAALRIQQAQLRVQSGDYAAGWQAWKWRSKVRRQRPVLIYPFPQWDGSQRLDQTLLVSAEDDLETELMFAACLPEVLPRVGHCVIDCLPELLPLFAKSFAGATLHACEYSEQQRWLAEVGRVDCQIQLGALPKLQRPDRASFPARRGHLLADVNAVQEYRQRLSTFGPGPKVGLAIAASGSARERSQRAPQIERWSALLATAPVEWVLIGGTTDYEALSPIAQAAGRRLHQLAPVDAAKQPEIVAAQAAALDVVVAVEGVAAHVAAGMGVETWVLLAPAASWRWPAEGEATPWYAAARLWRLTPAGRWDELLRRVGRALSRRSPAASVVPHSHLNWHGAAADASSWVAG